MSTTTAIAPVQRTILVKASLAHAFDVFTAGLTRWWPPNHGIGPKPIVKVLMEPKLGGRWLEISEDGTETTVATITTWDRPHRVVLVWQINARWQPDAAMRSEVDVRFTAEGTRTTKVSLLHHKFETMGAEDGAVMRTSVDGGWPGMLERFAAAAAGGDPGDVSIPPCQAR